MKVLLCIVGLCALVSSTLAVNLSTICKNRADGNYPHPDFCKMYIACSNGIAYEMPCPAGLNWNDEKKYCDWPFNAPCEVIIICEHQTDTVQCPVGKTIDISYANYGRTSPGSVFCPHPSIKTTNCVSSSAAIHTACQGKTSCTLHASNSVYGDPCVGTFKYIQVQYKCI